MRNPLEEGCYEQLTKAKRRGKYLVEYEQDKLPYVVEHIYIPDFTLTFPSGRKIYIEVKGYLRPQDRVKMVAVKRNNPDADIRFLFARDNRLQKGSKNTYGTWATKRGFPYAIGTIPKDWLVDK